MGYYEEPSLGLYINDGTEILQQPLTGIMYGTQGVGKTTEAGKAYPDALFCVTSLKNLRALASAGGKVPHHFYMPMVDQAGQRYDLVNTFADFLGRCINAVQAGTFPYSCLVLDEYSMIAKFIEPSLGGDGFAHIKAFHQWHESVCAVSTYLGIDCILLCHENEPKYNMKEGSPTYGKMQYRGGPQLPIGTAMDTLVSLPDYCLRVMVKAGGAVVVLTRPDPFWRIKARDLRLKKEEKFEMRRIIEMMKSAPPLDEAAQRKLVQESNQNDGVDSEEAAEQQRIDNAQSVKNAFSEGDSAVRPTGIKPGTTNSPVLQASPPKPGKK